MTGEMNHGYPIIIFFSSKYCVPCKPVEEMLKRINLSMFGKKLMINKIDIEEKGGMELSKKHNITTLPTLIISDKKLTVNIQEEDIIDAILQGFISSIKI